ncbi:hypothetical protein GLOIN_2v1787998 [Rhizophagus irregularis DAOM 181602=DAOM 197198]|nr:hypothetical protein GLOIN_2v1787998 [Rhizophagus irregularis DAOM 181602=DAOM 197198]
MFPLTYYFTSGYPNKPSVLDPEACMFINLLDDVIPLVLDFYPIIFRSGCWEVYEEAMLQIIKSSLHIFNDYYVENFHSCIRNQIILILLNKLLIKQK